MDKEQRLHPLHSIELVHNTLLMTGHHIGNRRTGRTTAHALSALGAAIANPFVPVVVVDHHGTPQANRHMLTVMRDMADRLGLDHLYFDMNRGTVTFGQQ